MSERWETHKYRGLCQLILIISIDKTEPAHGICAAWKPSVLVPLALYSHYLASIRVLWTSMQSTREGTY